MNRHRFRVIRAASIMLLLTFSAAQVAIAQDASRLTDDQLKSALHGMGALDFARLTSRGEFKGCELTYRKMFRDFRAHQGELVAAYGSISSTYVEGKVFSLFLKTRTAIMSPRTGALTRFQPGFAALSLGAPLAPFKTTEFKCEDDGICVAYGDNSKLELVGVALEKWPSPGPTITLTTSKEGYDVAINLRDILESPSPEKQQSAKAYFEFYECLGDVVKHMMESMKKSLKER